jgi:heat shock protein HslJ
MIVTRLKVILLLITVLFLVSCNKSGKEDLNNSKNSLNWSGSYRGVIPNLHNHGVYIELELTEGLTFTRRTKQFGTKDEVATIKGTFTWAEDGGSIILESDFESQNSILMVEKNKVIWKNIKGIEYSDDEISNYVLSKVPRILFEKEWIITQVSGEYINVRPTDNSEYVYINFSSDENKIFGYGGCNYFEAYYFLTGNEISFTPIKATKMTGANIKIESELFTNLKNTQKFEIIDSELFLKNEQGIHLIIANANEQEK